MEKSTKLQRILERLLIRTGGRYIFIVVIGVQIISSVTTLFGHIFEQITVNYPPEIEAYLNKIEIIVIPTLALTLLAIVLVLTRELRAQINLWKQNPDQFASKDHAKAWKSAQNIIWQYAIAAITLSFSFVIIPKALLLNTTNLISRDQIIYGIIAGLITNFGFVPFSAILFDRTMMPVRKILLPPNYSQQLSGLSKLRIIYKTLAIVFFSIIITALLVAPIGYRQATRILYEEIGSREVLRDLQTQTVLVSGLAIFFASGIAFLFAKSISDPLSELMDSFNKVENGDLTTRAPVISSDEVSQLAIYFNRMVARLEELQSDLEMKVEQRTSQLKAINEVGRVATSILDPDELLNRVVNLITAEFGYFFSAIYLIDQSGQWCELKEATGKEGQELKDVNHRVEMSNMNIIGKAIRTRQPQISLNVVDQPAQSSNTLLPDTRSELALPLLAGDQILGALDVHSAEEVIFSEQDIETLQNMANQVAISLDNARLFQETHQGLNEMRNIQKQYLREAWIDTNLPQGNVSLALGEGSGDDEANIIEVPIALRDQIIGQLSLEGEDSLSAEDQNLIHAIATQAALALENARLLEESQGAAMREKFVTEITNKIWASTSIDGVLKTAVRELGQILDATEATIEINIE